MGQEGLPTFVSALIAAIALGVLILAGLLIAAVIGA